jgi:hypothetical protein
MEIYPPWLVPSFNSVGKEIARGHTNLLLGSRCISGTHEAHSSYRVMGPLSAAGQAAGALRR